MFLFPLSFSILQHASNSQHGTESNAQKDGNDGALAAGTRHAGRRIMLIAVGAAGLLRDLADERGGSKRAANRNSDGANPGLRGGLAIGIRRCNGDSASLRRTPAPARTPADEAVEAAEAVPATVRTHEPGRAVEGAPRDGDDAARPCSGRGIGRGPIGPVLAVVTAVGTAPLAPWPAVAGTELASRTPAAGRGPRHGPAGVCDGLDASAAGARARCVPGAEG